MNILTQIPFSLEPDRLMRDAHVMPGSEDMDDFLGLLDLARLVGKPKAAYAEAFVERQQGDAIQINGITFTSRVLSRNLSEVERVFPVLMTCGLEMDEAFQEHGDVLMSYWWDQIKTELLFAAEQALETHLHTTYRLNKTAVMRPGSGDVSVWPIEQQHGVFALLGEAAGQIGVTLTDSFLMTPNKTGSGILFPTMKEFHECAICLRENCLLRRAPLDSAKQMLFCTEDEAFFKDFSGTGAVK